MRSATLAKDHEGAHAKSNTESLGAAIESALRRSLETAVGRIAEINRLTEDGALSAGRSLEAIVHEAQSYARHTRSTLEAIAGSADQQGIADVLASQHDVLEAFLREIGAHVERQAEVAEAAVRSSSQIARLGGEISAVAFQSRLLSLNASIEAARMGAQGKAFGVIAAEMTKLSQQVESTSKSVSELVSTLSATLPSVSEAAHEMRSASQDFTAQISCSISQVDRHVKELDRSVQQTLSAGDSAVARILTHSQGALSSLQFQDPAAQGMIAVARDFDTAVRAAIGMLGSAGHAERNAPAGPAQSGERPRTLPIEAITHVAVVAKASDTPPPGEVMLF